MKESEREFLRDLGGQFHNTTALVLEGIETAIEKAPPRKDYELWEKERKLKEYQEKAKLARYRREGLNDQERKASEGALREMLKPINEQIKRNQAREANFWDNFNKRNANQEGREQVERLLEIAQDRNDYLNGRIREAEEMGNDLLLEQYTQEKAENDKNLELYRGKYEEYKAAEEG